MPIYTYIHIFIHIYIYTPHFLIIYIYIYMVGFLVEKTCVHINAMLVGCIYVMSGFLSPQNPLGLGFSLKESTQINLVGSCLHRMYIVIVVFHTYSWEVLLIQDVYIFSLGKCHV